MPYWRLSGFYFFYFAVLGALMPYWGLFLQHRGFDAVAIGELIAILMATKIVAPNLWGWLGDHLGHRMMIIRVASLISAVIFLGMFWATGYWAIAIVMVWYSFFWDAALPQFEVVTFTYLGKRIERYAQVRVWGSVGFIFTVAALGVLVDLATPEIILFVVMFLFVGTWLVSHSIKDPDPEPHPLQQDSLFTVLKRPAILLFLTIVFLMQMSHGPYYAFYSIHMENYGYSKTVIGQLWALGVLSEVVIFMLVHRMLAHWGAGIWLVISLLLAALRWVIIAYLPESLFWLIVAQTVHAATFGLFHAAAIHLVHHYFRGRLQGRGQALYSSVSFGAGGALGILLSGYAWEPWGAELTFMLAGSIALLGAMLALGLIMIDSTARYTRQSDTG